MKINSLDTAILSPSNCYPSVDLNIDSSTVDIRQLDKFVALNRNTPEFVPYTAAFANVAATGWKDPQLPEMDNIIDHCKNNYSFHLTNIMLCKFGCGNIPQPIVDRFTEYSRLFRKNEATRIYDDIEDPFDDEDEAGNTHRRDIMDFSSRKIFNHDHAENYYILRDSLLFNITNIYLYIGHFCINWLERHTAKISSTLNITKFVNHDSADTDKMIRIEKYKRCVRLLACVTLAAQQHNIKIPIPKNLINNALFQLCASNIHRSVLQNHFSKQGDPVQLILDSWGMGYQEMSMELLKKICDAFMTAKATSDNAVYRSTFKDAFSLIAAPFDPSLAAFMQFNTRNPREKDIQGSSYRPWYASALSLLQGNSRLPTYQYIARELCTEWRTGYSSYYGWSELTSNDIDEHIVTIAKRMDFNFDDIVGSFYNINKTHAIWAFTKFNDLYDCGLKMGPRGEKMLLMMQIKKQSLTDTMRSRVDNTIGNMIKKGDLDDKEKKK